MNALYSVLQARSGRRASAFSSCTGSGVTVVARPGLLTSSFHLRATWPEGLSRYETVVGTLPDSMNQSGNLNPGHSNQSLAARSYLPTLKPACCHVELHHMPSADLSVQVRCRNYRRQAYGVGTLFTCGE